MKNRTIGIVAGIAAGIAGLAGLVTPVMVSRAEKARVEALDIYIEQPELSEVVRKAGDAIVGQISKSDYFKGVSHPQSGRVYVLPTNPEARVTNYINPLDLEKKLGRAPVAVLTVTERKLGVDQSGNDLWVFDNLWYFGQDLMLAETRAKVPWIFQAAENKKPYTLKTEKDSAGKVRKLTYNLADGNTITLEDTNRNCIADTFRKN